MPGLCKSRLQGQTLLSRAIGEPFQALLQIGVLLLKTRRRRHRHHKPTQIKPLEVRGRPCRRQAIEIEYTSEATWFEQTGHLLQSHHRIREVAQAIGHHNPIGRGIRQPRGQGIPLLEHNIQPGLTALAVTGELQRCCRSIQTQH